MLAVIQSIVFTHPLSKNMWIEIFKTIILPVDLCKEENWSFSLRKIIDWGCLRIGC